MLWKHSFPSPDANLRSKGCAPDKSGSDAHMYQKFVVFGTRFTYSECSKLKEGVCVGAHVLYLCRCTCTISMVPCALPYACQMCAISVGNLFGRMSNSTAVNFGYRAHFANSAAGEIVRRKHCISLKILQLSNCHIKFVLINQIKH